MQEQPKQPPICGAKTTQGACQNQPVAGKKRCHRHGGAPGTGAPKGNKNAWKHGQFSREAIAERRMAKQFLIESQDFLSQILNDGIFR